MATLQQVTALRLLIAEPDDVDPYTETALYARIDGVTGNLDLLAYQIWTEKAAAAAGLVNISEAGSSRASGDLYEQALDMAKVFAERAGQGADPSSPNKRTRLHRLTRT